MEEKILLEITNHCESCPCHEKLVEEETKDERNNN